MSQLKKRQQIIHQELALDSYLRTLLDEIADDEPVGRDKAETSPPEVVAKTQVKTDTKVKVRTEKKIKQSSVPVNEVKTASRQLQVIKAPPETVKVQPLSVMPEWTQHEFQALFFKVDQLILAVPLTDLLRTIKIDRQPTHIPGQPSWFMGLLDEHDCRVGVLDTGQLVYGKKRGRLRDHEINPYSSILITQDGKWGLACDEVLSISRLSPDKVRWRTLRDKRPWLIGTVIDELTAVIEMEKLVPHRKTG